MGREWDSGPTSIPNPRTNKQNNEAQFYNQNSVTRCDQMSISRHVD